MAKFSHSLKFPAVSLLLLVVWRVDLASGAVVSSYGPRCGYGYEQCPEGFTCVRNTDYTYRPNISTCQKLEYSATETANLASTSLYYPSLSSTAPSSPAESYRSESLFTTRPEYSPTNPGYATPTEYIPGPIPSTKFLHTLEPIYTLSRSTQPSGAESTSYVDISPGSGYPTYAPTPVSNGPKYPLNPGNVTSIYASDPRYGTDYHLKTGYPSKPSGSPPNPENPSSKFTAVVGVPKGVVDRRSIEVLHQNHPDVFNLILLALESLQKKDENHDLSYYQLSGIHGYPFIPWQYPRNPPEPQLGYCTHNSAIFTTWHRPYLVLLEQTLYEEAVTIAKRFTGSNALKYKAAAEEVRLPYWDWAADETESRMPKIISEASVAVIRPGSTSPTMIANPFYNYRRRDIGVATIRDANADTELLDTFVERQLLTNSLFSDTSFDDFSVNLEDIHNLVHVQIGGDMADVFRAAFDPVFWLHHCNVDRLTAMYQASHPDLYLTPHPRSPTFALSGPGPDDLSTPLYPFRHPNAKEWTSNDVKTAESIFDYGYAYPEVPYGKSRDELKLIATERANQLYGPKIDSSFEGEESGADAPTARREWNANVFVDSNELPGSQQISLFIGDSQQNNSRSNSNDLAGVAAVFSSSTTHLDSPNRYLNITVPLTQTLVDKNVGLRPEDVVPKLLKDLRWTVKQVGTSKKTIPVADLKSLKISISSNVVEYPEDKTKLPVKSDPEPVVAPTTGKVGGSQPDQASLIGVRARPAFNSTSTV